MYTITLIHKSGSIRTEDVATDDIFEYFSDAIERGRFFGYVTVYIGMKELGTMISLHTDEE